MKNKKLLLLREKMKEENIDIYIIPSSDFHQSEYVSDYFKGRKWITNFTGSAGTAVITKDKAGLWTDGRYFIQAEKELIDSGFELFKMGVEGVPDHLEWIKSNASNENIVGFDGKTLALSSYEKLKDGFSDNNFKIDKDLLEEVWSDRPAFPKEKIFLHEIKYAGRTFSEKLKDVRDCYQNKGANMYFISSLDDIAWLFNLRGRDVTNNSTFYSYALISDEDTTLFIDSCKIDSKVSDYLKENNVIVKEYNDISNILTTIENKKVYLSPTKTSIYIKSLLGRNEFILGDEITTQLKAIKNHVEIENFKKTYLNDSIALLRGFKYIEENFMKKELTELDVEDIIKSEREKLEGYFSISFDTIAGHKDHGALMHFKANKENTYTLEPKSFLLVDSGGHYLGGTTDITRTFALGEPTPEEKKDFTLVLKSVIMLSKAKFLKGTTGYRLDLLARYPLWLEGMDYKCGTGHGVGFFLNIHEGPQGFSVKNSSDIPFEVGMNLTIEPGVYKEGKHGIRTENTVVVKEAFTNKDGTFYEFETISFFPIDRNSIDTSILNSDELNWINSYHETTYNTLSPHLSQEEKDWLKEKTLPL